MLKNSSKDVEVITNNVAYQGYFRIRQLQVKHRLFNGAWSQTITREVFERPEGAMIVLYDPILRQTVLVEQFRCGTLGMKEKPWLLECVAGVIDYEATPEAVAEHETAEEAGLTVTNIMPLYRCWVSPGASNERVHCFCGRVDASKAQGIHGVVAEGEDIRVIAMPTSEAYQLLRDNKIENVLAIVGLQWLQLHEESLCQQWLK